MKKYKTIEELIADMKIAFSGDNPFDKYIYDRLATPKLLIKEFKNNPTLALGNNRGDWMFVWKNRQVKIEDEWVRIEDLLDKLSEFLEKEVLGMKICPNCESKNVEMTGVNRGVPTLGNEIPLANLLGYKCKDCGNLFDVQIKL